MFAVKRWLVGSPLPTAQAVHERLTKRVALAVFSSDPLSSVAYASQEILYVLVHAGAAGILLCLPISFGIAALLIIVVVSYRQTVAAYPSGGGAYIVAKDNLGRLPGLVAAAALLIDYILTVAVSAAAGINAITSAVPALTPYATLLCIASVVGISLMNLRGVKESGRFFAVPTYLFIGSFGLLLVGAFFRFATGQLAPVAAPAIPLGTPLHPVTLYLVLRAFAAGCTALTGVEAISNGVPAFHPPEARNAGITLSWMAVIATTFFVGASFLAVRLGAHPSEQDTVISQIAWQTYQGGFLYYLLQASTALILVLAVNTAFADFPRLASILARDRFLPRQFANRGDRLVFSNGILFLGTSAIVLLIIFRGSAHALLPLYAVGVFLSFTLSQGGMVVHHWRLKEPAWKRGLVINAFGAVCTGVVLAVITLTKFIHGAWVVAVLIPIFVAMFLKVNRHYGEVRERLSLEGMTPSTESLRVTAVVPVSELHTGVLAALRYARSLTEDVRAVTVDLETGSTQALTGQWSRYGLGIPLVVLDSPARSVLRPLLDYVDDLTKRDARRLVAVVIPEAIPARWWDYLLHNQTVLLIKGALLLRPGTIVTSVPYHLGSAVRRPSPVPAAERAGVALPATALPRRG